METSYGIFTATVFILSLFTYVNDEMHKVVEVTFIAPIFHLLIAKILFSNRQNVQRNFGSSVQLDICTQQFSKHQQYFFKK